MAVEGTLAHARNRRLDEALDRIAFGRRRRRADDISNAFGRRRIDQPPLNLVAHLIRALLAIELNDVRLCSCALVRSELILTNAAIFKVLL